MMKSRGDMEEKKKQRQREGKLNQVLQVHAVFGISISVTVRAWRRHKKKESLSCWPALKCFWLLAVRWSRRRDGERRGTGELF